MNAVAAERCRKVGTLVDEKGDTPRLHLRHQRLDRAPDRVVAGVGQAKLKRSDIAGVERRIEHKRKRRRLDRRRRDQVETRGQDQALFWKIRMMVSSIAIASFGGRWKVLRPMIEPVAPPSRSPRISA